MQRSLSLAQRLTQAGLAVLLTGAGLVLHPAISAADDRMPAQPSDAAFAAGRAVTVPDNSTAPDVSAVPDNLSIPGGSSVPGDSSVPDGASVPGGASFPDGSFGRAPLRIMPLGDSLTWGKGSSDGSGYRVDLSSWLALAGLDTDFVGSQSNGSGPDLDHEGHPGWRIAQIDAQVATWIPQAAPDVILLDIGTNDLLRRDAVTKAPARLATLIDHLIELAPNTRIVLAKLLVVRPEFRTFNNTMAKIATTRPGHVWLADMSGISPEETVDHVHPTDLGYRAMAAEWYRSLTDVIPGGHTWTTLPPTP